MKFHSEGCLEFSNYDNLLYLHFITLKRFMNSVVMHACEAFGVTARKGKD